MKLLTVCRKTSIERHLKAHPVRTIRVQDWLRRKEFGLATKQTARQRVVPRSPALNRTGWYAASPGPSIIGAAGRLACLRQATNSVT